MEEEGEVRSKMPLIRRVDWGAERAEYKPIILVTGRGEVECRYYPVSGTNLGALWVGGVGGDFDSPARGLYPRLCEKLKGNEIASLRVQFRSPTVLEEATYDVLAGISFLESEGIANIALTGHSFGGAVVIRAGARSDSVRTVVTLATQGHGADMVSELSPDCSILLIHGAEDRVLPSDSSRQVFEMAHEPKRLIILQGNGHGLEESAQEVEGIVEDWIVSKLRPPSQVSESA